MRGFASKVRLRKRVVPLSLHCLIACVAQNVKVPKETPVTEAAAEKWDLHVERQIPQ